MLCCEEGRSRRCALSPQCVPVPVTIQPGWLTPYCLLTNACTHTSCTVLCRYVDEVNLLDDGLVDVVLDSGARSWLATIAAAQLADNHCCCSACWLITIAVAHLGTVAKLQWAWC